MARNGDSKIICRAGARDRTDRLWQADPSDDLGVTHRLANGNVLKGLLHPLLKGGSAHIEGQSETDAGLLDHPNYAGHQGFIVAIRADQLSLRKTILEAPDHLIGIIVEQDGGNALLARSDQGGTKGGLSDGEFELLVFAPARYCEGGFGGNN